MIQNTVATKKDLFEFFLPLLLFLFSLAACRPDDKEAKAESKDYPAIFPDYTGVTVPCNIAPLNFSVPEAREIKAVQSKQIWKRVGTIAGRIVREVS